MLVHERVKFIKFDDIELSSHGYYQGYSACEFETKNGPKIINIILIVLLWIITARYGHPIGTVGNPYTVPVSI